MIMKNQLSLIAHLVLLCLSLRISFCQSGNLERARDLMKQFPLIDGHNDLPSRFRSRGYDLQQLPIHTNLTGITQTDISRLRQGLLGGQFWSVFIGCNYQDRNAVSATLEQIDIVYQMVERYPQVFQIARTADEVEEAFASGRIASLMGAEGGHQIDASLGTLRMFYELGVRYMTLTHNCNTPWSDAQNGPDEHGGLTEFGKEVIREMNRIGMLVDISHTRHTTMRDSLETSIAPLIFSHTCCYHFVQIERNVPDDVLVGLGENGGIAMVTFVGNFLVPQGQATVSDVADHIDHIRDVAGIDHVGIGGDYDGTSSLPIGMEDVSGYPLLIAELLDRGYSDEDIAKVMGGNILRVMREVEKIAEELSGVPESTEYLPYRTDCRIPISDSSDKVPEEDQ